MCSHNFRSLNQSIHDIVEFAKQVPGLCDLQPEDQLVLVKQVRIE